MSFHNTPRQRRPLHASLRKWTAGGQIEDLNELAFQIAKRRYIFVKDRSAGYHWSFVAGWQFSYIARLIRSGVLLRGIRNPDIPYTFTAQWCEAVPHATVKSCYVADCYEIGATGIHARTRSAIMKKCREAVFQHIGHSQCKVAVTFNEEEKS